MLKNFILNKLNQISNVFGLSVLSSKSLDAFNSNLSSCLSLLQEYEFAADKEGISCIIFSKDRALQLLALLESMNKRFINFSKLKVIILFKVSDIRHRKSYQELQIMMSNSPFYIEWREQETHFKSDLVNVLNSIDSAKLFFLTDDNLVINDIDIELANTFNSNNYIFSMRHSLGINYSFNMQQNIKPPKLIPVEGCVDYYEFNWFESPHEWSDPWSLDGHIYGVTEILILAKVLDYQAPNSFEASLKMLNFQIGCRKGVCMKRSGVINIPLNLTQSEWVNRCGNLGIQECLNKWDMGMKFNIAELNDYNPRSTHEIHNLKFVNRL